MTSVTGASTPAATAGSAVTALSLMTMTSRSRFGRKRSEERRVGKECRSRCDWSSDVCSSDLNDQRHRRVNAGRNRRVGGDRAVADDDDLTVEIWKKEIGRASCRERV